ncbi:hypothetical protein BZA70DRAFT_290803 [Myxozyma melibiosi]|uniref:DnaJ-domain-containing protein n=1 Tax=Myxozyma melibiosi TaxID=54550 RepID=A0ABR1F1N3_9ASCO
MEEDLYAVLGVHKTATSAEIKKAYHKAALASHPDKVPEEEREEAEVRFKVVSQAYEILSDDSQRSLYDRHGMDAFTKGRAPSYEDDFQDFFGFGGGPGFRDNGYGGSQFGSKPRTENAQFEISISLKNAYIGKTEKMSIKRNIVCQTCKGSGAKSTAKPRKCGHCKGAGVVPGHMPIGGGMSIQVNRNCPVCAGSGNIVKDKDKCKKCKGKMILEETKIIEVYIPPGIQDGEKIVKKGMADEAVRQETGDIIFIINIEKHDQFTRVGNDLRATINITLVEALCGLDRQIIQHLDERVLRLKVPPGKVISPGKILLVEGEGMPIKSGPNAGGRGDLYLDIDIEFPKDNWFADRSEMRRVADSLTFPPSKPVYTPKSETDAPPIEDMVAFNLVDSDAEFGKYEGYHGEDNEDDWDDEEEEQGAECATQ